MNSVLESVISDGSGRKLGRRVNGDIIRHRPERNLTFSSSKPVSLAVFVGDNDHMVEALLVFFR